MISWRQLSKGAEGCSELWVKLPEPSHQRPEFVPLLDPEPFVCWTRPTRSSGRPEAFSFAWFITLFAWRVKVRVRHEGVYACAGRREQQPANRRAPLPKSLPLRGFSDRRGSLGQVDEPA
jgi:hypothetical protein